jgi:3-oxoacyl-[acyl-carrier protein] reductase
MRRQERWMYMVPRRSVSSPAAASGTGETPGQSSTRASYQGRFAGRVMVVTGASRGIGAAVARRFAADGARVIVTYYPSQEMRELAHAVVEDILGGGGRANAVALDVADPASVAEAFRIVREQAGPVDVLVNNAAQTLRKPWEEIELAEWDSVMDVNVRGALLCCQAAYTDMAARQRGVYIMAGSVEVALGRAGGLAYVTSKAALVGFTRSLAREAGPKNIRANLVMLGAVRTEAETEFDPDGGATRERLAGCQSLPGRLAPDDVTGAFAFLASDDSAHITGQVLNVDGGWVNY